MAELHMFTAITTCIVIFFGGDALGQTAVTPKQTPIFIYATAGNPDTVNWRESGILIDWLDELANRSNEPDLAAMYEVLGGMSQQERFANTFGCAFVASSEPCQPVVLLDEENAFLQAFVDHGVSRTWFLHITEQATQAGYNFSVTAIDLEFSSGSVQYHEDLMVWYQDIFSPGSDAQSRGLNRQDRRASPKIGSHAARTEYWISGSPPRMQRVVHEAPMNAADMLRYLSTYARDMTHKEYKQQIKSLDKVRDVEHLYDSKCRGKWGLCNTRVVDYTADRVRVLSFARKPWMKSINLPALN